MSSIEAERSKAKVVKGVVCSDAMDKTIAVRVVRLVPHKTLGKYIRRYTKYKAHDEKNEAKIGDRVTIIESKPLSKTKRWRLAKIVGSQK